jgi:hypothetical protein
MTGSKNANDALPATPDTLLNAGNDAKIELSDADLNKVTGGGDPKTSTFKQLQDVTNNQQTTAQKAAEKADQYIRS